MKLDINEFTFQFKFKDDPQMPAVLTLLIGQFQIRGFRIMKSKFADASKTHYLTPPANRLGNGKFIKLFWADKEDWALLEKRALEQFDEELMNQEVSKL